MAMQAKRATVMSSILRYLFSLFAASAVFCNPGIAAAQTSLNPLLTPYLSRYDLPAVAAAAIKDGKILSAGAVGTRRAGTTIPVTINDRFHIGSDTKAMTALLAAMMVEEGKLRWSSTMADVFPELAAKMDLRLRPVTLEQLLSHTGGLPSDNEAVFSLYMEAMSQEGNLDELRSWLVGQWCTRPPASEPGTTFAGSRHTRRLPKIGKNQQWISGALHDRIAVKEIGEYIC